MTPSRRARPPTNSTSTRRSSACWSSSGGKGRPVGDDELIGSDLILPPADVSLQEAKAEFKGEGLIPG